MLPKPRAFGIAEHLEPLPRSMVTGRSGPWPCAAVIRRMYSCIAGVVAGGDGCPRRCSRVLIVSLETPLAGARVMAHLDRAPCARCGLGVVAFMGAQWVAHFSVCAYAVASHFAARRVERCFGRSYRRDFNHPPS